MAYITAITHGLTEEAQALAAKINGEAPEPLKNAQLLQPPTPIMRVHESNWPLLTVSKGYFEGAMREEERKVASGLASVPEDESPSEWGEVDIPDEDGERPKDEDLFGEEPSGEVNKEEPESTEKGTWGDLDLDLGADVEDTEVATTSAQKSNDRAFIVLPQSGPSIGQIWVNNSNLAADHAAAGYFESAMRVGNFTIYVN